MPRVFDAAASYDSLRAWLAEQWRAGDEAWETDARAIFTELGLVGTAASRQLLESETFRALLEQSAIELPEAA